MNNYWYKKEIYRCPCCDYKYNKKIRIYGNKPKDKSERVETIPVYDFMCCERKEMKTNEELTFVYDTNNLEDITRDVEEALDDLIPDHCCFEGGHFSGKYILTIKFVERG
jgi:hypothetical protein